MLPTSAPALGAVALSRARPSPILAAMANLARVPGSEGGPRRPVLVEVAAALLIVTGATGVVSAVGTLAGAGEGGQLLLFRLSISLLTVLIGLLVRSGQGWVIAVNFVAIALFLEFAAATGGGLSLLYLAIDSFVLVVLFAERRWFGFWRREPPPREGGEDDDSVSP